MNTLRTRIARLTAASALVLGLGALGAGPALAESPVTWSSADSITLAFEDGAGTDGICHASRPNCLA
jgi:hypothetical protein